MARAHWVYFELFTPDLAASTAFYTAVAGWTKQPSDDPAYVTMNAGDETAGGLRDPRIAGAAPQWVAFFSVDDIDSAVAAITRHGGAVVAPAEDLPGVGRTAGVADPFGGVFFLFQSAGPEGGGKPFPWMELFVDDPGAAAAWYAEALGLTVSEMPMPDGPYQMLTFEERPVAGVTKRRGWATPNAWVPVARVADLDAALRAAEAQGGTVPEPAQSAPEIGRFAWVIDPNGAALELLQEPG